MSSKYSFENQRGSALLIVLAFILLISFLVVAFLTRSRGDLSASANYSSTVQAEEIAQTGSDFLVGGLQREIRQAISVTGPKATVWPARTVENDANNAGDAINTDASRSTDETNPREFLPFRTSTGKSQSVYNGILNLAYGNIAANVVPNVGSSIKTSTQPGSGLPFDNSRWNASKLLPYTPQSQFDWINCPTWVYVTRSGPKSPDAPAPYTATVAQMRDLSAGNENAAIGRFAYIMYDVSGLLDANIIALAEASFTSVPQFGEKGSSAFTSPQRIMDFVGSGGDASAFASWRQPTSVDMYGSVTGSASAPGLIEEGMLTAPDGSNVFFSRQEMIKFSNDNPLTLRGGRLSTADNDGGALPFLRTRSRGFSGPTLDLVQPGPGAASWTVASTDQMIPRYRTSDGQREDYKIVAGEPTFLRKFPLSRLRWFSTDAANDGEPASRFTQGIKQHFGLTWVPNLGTYASTTPEWANVPGFIYTGVDGASPKSTIKTLQEVAAENREPDFFEWLKAAIDPDTLGLDGGMTNSAVALDQDRSADFQIIQIGANIIDQADPDDVPTRILSTTARDRNEHGLVAIGVENVPLMNEIIVSYKRAGEYGTSDASTIEAWIQPEIWMPHFSESGKAKEARTDFEGTKSINDFRFRVVEGEAWLDAWAEYQAGGSILIPMRNASMDYREIEAREFSGDPADDGFEFTLDSEDFSEPTLPGTSAKWNPFYTGVVNNPAALRRVFAGPEPGTAGFKGVLGGRVRNAGIVPGASLSTNYADRVYYWSGGYAMGANAGLEIYRNRDKNNNGLDDQTDEGGTLSQETFPLGERYYNAVSYYATPLTLPPRHHPSNGSGSPIPLTFVLEMKVGTEWSPIQVIETACYLPKVHVLTTRRLPSSVPDTRGSGVTTGSGSVSSGGNFQTTGASAGSLFIPGYDTLLLGAAAQETLGTNFAKTSAPELLSWCRPILAGEDPDPSNNRYPLGATKPTINRYDTDQRNPNEFLARNQIVGSKPGLGLGTGGSATDPTYADLFFGWSNTYKSGWSKTDPRTRRFGQGGSYSSSPGSTIRATSQSWIKDANNTDYWSNWDMPFIAPPGNSWKTSGSTVALGGLLSNWSAKVLASGRPYMPLADLMRNLDSASTSVFYRDKDNEVRPADWAYASDDALPTLPLVARQAGDPVFPDAAVARPVVLNRMFRSPAELGLVFRDVPWRSLDFFSDATVSGSGEITARSGDLGLLDVFCIEDNVAGLSAGKVDPNKAPASVLEALIGGTLEQPGKTDIITKLDGISEINAVVNDFISKVVYDPSDPQASPAIASDSGVAKVLMSDTGVKPSTGSRKQKAAAEAFLRGLSGSTDTRTWNILIDLVAESGRLTPAANSLQNFAVSAQRRFWIFVALDRITGRVVDYKMEIVNE